MYWQQMRNVIVKDDFNQDKDIDYIHFTSYLLLLSARKIHFDTLLLYCGL